MRLEHMSHAYTWKEKQYEMKNMWKSKLILKGTRMETQKYFERKEKFEKYDLINLTSNCLENHYKTRPFSIYHKNKKHRKK